MKLDMKRFKDVDIPILFVLVGLPGSGKSQCAIDIAKAFDGKIRVLSSDAIRKEFFGDESAQDQPGRVFEELNRRTKDCLSGGVSVVYDATNINKKRRAALLSALRNVKCMKIGYAVMTPYEICVKRCAERERTVPEYVVRRMLMHYSPPHRSEGFDLVYFDYSHSEIENSYEYTIENIYNHPNGFMELDQQNKHHTLSVGDHCLQAMKKITELRPDRFDLQLAAFFHDIGKGFTKTDKNAKGEYDGDCHYYQHHCVGSYETALYLRNMFDDLTLSNRNGEVVDFEMKRQEYISDISTMVFYHMHPYMSWSASKKSEQRDKAILGESMFNDIMLIHQADVDAH